MTPAHIFPSIGTNTTPYYIPANDKPEITFTDQGYFAVQAYGAQAAFTGWFWEASKRLVVTSRVNLHLGDRHHYGDQNLHGILAYRSLNKNNATELGFSPMLIDFMPATMKRVSISIQYLVDTSNYLAKLVSLIESNDLFSMISLAPGASIAAQTVGKLAGKLIDTFVPQEERKPILQFSGDFDLAGEGLKEGFYVILGSHDPRNPLPAVRPKLEIVEGGQLNANGQPVTQLSYIILRVSCTKSVRDRFTGHSPWSDKLQEAKRAAQDYAEDHFAKVNKKTRQEVWEKQCLPLLREAHALLIADPNFLTAEVELIYRSAYHECQEAITGKLSTRVHDPRANTSVWIPDERADRAFLGIPDNEDLEARLSLYAEQVYSARRKFKELGLR